MDKVTIREATPDDIATLAKRMRTADQDEVWARNHFTPAEALENSFRQSMARNVLQKGDLPVAMFGMGPYHLLGVRACIWELGTDDIETIPVSFLKRSREVIAGFLNRYPILENWVDIRNDASIRWLKRLGAEFDPPEPHGVEGKLFQHFVIRRGDHLV